MSTDLIQINILKGRKNVMRAYYTRYNNKIYELANHDMRPFQIMEDPKKNSASVSMDSRRRSARVTLSISDMIESALSNAEYFNEVINQLKTEKTTNIEKLSPVYRIYVEYMLYDNVCGTVADQTVAVKEVRSSTFLFLLGLTDTEELVGREGLSMDCTIEKTYRDATPYGISYVNMDNRFTLYIGRIYVVQVKMSAYSIVPMEEGRIDPHVRPFIPHQFNPGHCPTHNLGMPHHPSVPPTLYHPEDVFSMNDGVIIYDTLATGLRFDPIEINFRPTRIELDVRFSLLSVLVATSESINAVLEENAHVDEPTVDDDTNITDPDGDNTGDAEITDPEETPEGGNTSSDGNIEEGSGEGDVIEPTTPGVGGEDTEEGTTDPETPEDGTE